MRRPATILFLSASPSEAPSLALGQEARVIQERLQSSELRDAFRFEQA